MTTLYSYAPSGNDEAAFVAAYIECAVWANGQDDASDEDKAILTDEARTFVSDEHTVRLIQAAIFRASRMRSGYDFAAAGHDFYLTREGHGAGFWDRGLGAVGDALTELSKPYGSSDYWPESDDDDDGSV